MGAWNAPPTSVPVLAIAREGGFELGISSIDLYEDAWGVRGRLIGPAVETMLFRLAASGDSGVPFDGIGGGGSSGDAVHDFVWYFAADPPVGETVRLVGTADEQRIEISFTIPEAPTAREAVIGRVEDASSSRWPGPDESVWRSSAHRTVLKQVFNRRSTGALPDEVVSLGVTAGDIAGYELAFLGAELWDDVWLLSHDWENPAAMYSPLRGDLEVVDDVATTVGVWIGGGTSPCGIGSTHGFVMRRLPDQFTLRFPAAGNGPPLLEVEVAARR